MPKLTKSLVEAIEPEADRPVHVWDSQLAGFGVKVLASGVRRYLVKYRAAGGGRAAPQRWLTLGSHGPLTCEGASEMARQALASVARGDDPQGDKLSKRKSARMLDVWERFAVEQLPLKKPSTAQDYARQWQEILAPALGARLVSDLSRADVDRLHKRLRNTPYRANRTLALLSRLMTLAEAWGWRDQGTNPCRYVERFREEARERYLSADEIGRIGAAMTEMLAAGDIYPESAAAVRLLLLTGARLNEILTARWDWVDVERRVINLPDSKTGKKPIYLSDAALEVIAELEGARRDSNNPFLLPGRRRGKPLNNLSKPWKRICARAGLSGVRLHELRHTAASVAVGRGVNLPVIGRLLGHRQAQTTLRYAHVDADPALAAANEIGAAIGGAIGGAAFSAK
jgi:integrase